MTEAPQAPLDSAATTPPASPEAARFAANLEALKAWAPSLQAQLAALEEAHSELVLDDGVDIAFMGQRFYRTDARAFSEAQVAQFFAKPVRNVLHEPDPENLKGGIGDFCTRIKARLPEAGIEYDPQGLGEESHFLVVLGIGLGFHLPALLERSRCRCLVLVEPTLENLYHSLRVLDWAALLARAAERGVEITFITDRDPTAIALKTLSTLRGNIPVLCDGLYLFTHYPAVILQQAAATLQREIYSTVRGLGFFEDEEMMLRNSVANLNRPEVRFVDQPLPPQTQPLFIVGSGPSLEREIAFLKTCADRVAIMSIGTTLRILLAQGIRPDLHIELENTENNARSIEATAAEFDTEGITLVGALSVDRRLADCFSRAVFFLREENSGTVLLGQPIMTLSPSGPTVANAALVAAIRFGFREIYLFGVDMGSREEGKHHADGSVFSTGVLPENRRAHLRFAGNLGGEAWGEAVLNWSRQYLEAVLRMFQGVTVCNCSDGVRIDGAIPKVSRAIELPPEPLDRGRLLAQVEAGFTRMDRAAIAGACLDRIAAAREEGLIDRLLQLLEAATAAEDQADVEWAYEAFALLDAEDKGQSLVRSFVHGSLQMILGCALWYDRRIQDPGQRAAFRRIALQEAVAGLRTFRDRLREALDESEKVLTQPLESAPAKAAS